MSPIWVIMISKSFFFLKRDLVKQPEKTCTLIPQEIFEGSCFEACRYCKSRYSEFPYTPSLVIRGSGFYFKPARNPESLPGAKTASLWPNPHPYLRQPHAPFKSWKELMYILQIISPQIVIFQIFKSAYVTQVWFSHPPIHPSFCAW